MYYFVTHTHTALVVFNSPTIKWLKQTLDNQKEGNPRHSSLNLKFLVKAFYIQRRAPSISLLLISLFCHDEPSEHSALSFLSEDTGQYSKEVSDKS